MHVAYALSLCCCSLDGLLAGCSGNTFSAKGAQQCSSCGTNAVAITNNTDCKCQPGYRNWTESGCTDIDECADGTSGCQHVDLCTNKPGSYECSCPAGSILAEDKHNCTGGCAGAVSQGHGIVWQIRTLLFSEMDTPHMHLPNITRQLCSIVTTRRRQSFCPVPRVCHHMWHTATVLVHLTWRLMQQYWVQRASRTNYPRH